MAAASLAMDEVFNEIGILAWGLDRSKKIIIPFIRFDLREGGDGVKKIVAQP